MSFASTTLLRASVLLLCAGMATAQQTGTHGGPLQAGTDGVGGIEKVPGVAPQRTLSPAPVSPPLAPPVPSGPVAGDWLQLGHSMPASTLPLLAGTTRTGAEGTDSLDGAPTLTLHLSEVLPSAPVMLVLGTQALAMPFHGGILLPAPELVVTGLRADGNGGLELSVALPAEGLPPGFTLLAQAWCADAAGPQGFAASNALAFVAAR